jgi:hypothetical protein
VNQDGTIAVRCKESEARVAELLSEHPNLPQLAWVLAVCRREVGNPSWRDSARRCTTLTAEIVNLKPHADWYANLAAACDKLLSD